MSQYVFKYRHCTIFAIHRYVHLKDIIADDDDDDDIPYWVVKVIALP